MLEESRGLLFVLSSGMSLSAYVRQRQQLVHSRSVPEQPANTLHFVRLTFTRPTQCASADFAVERCLDVKCRYCKNSVTQS